MPNKKLIKNFIQSDIQDSDVLFKDLIKNILNYNKKLENIESKNLDSKEIFTGNSFEVYFKTKNIENLENTDSNNSLSLKNNSNKNKKTKIILKNQFTEEYSEYKIKYFIKKITKYFIKNSKII